MNNELNVLQALEMPIGTRFLIKDTNGYSLDYVEVLKGTDMKILCWNGRRELIVQMCTSVAKMKLIPIPKPVSFMEVVESGKKCRVEHKLINELEDPFEVEKLNMFNDLDWILFYICNNDLDVHEIITNGKWYIDPITELDNGKLEAYRALSYSTSVSNVKS